jgi:hypothetical protein
LVAEGFSGFAEILLSLFAEAGSEASWSWFWPKLSELDGTIWFLLIVGFVGHDKF